MKETKMYYVLLDHLSRGLIKIGSLGSSLDVTIINSLDELNSDKCKKGDVLCVFDSYLKSSDSHSSLRLFASILQLDCYVLGKEQIISAGLIDLCKFVHYDYSELDYKKLLTLLASANKVNYSSNVVFSDESYKLANLLLSDNEIPLEVREIFSNYLLNKQLYEDLLIKYRDSLERTKDLEISVASLNESVSKYSKYYAEILKDTVKINHMLDTYGTMLTSDVFVKVNMSNYNNSPKVLYLKEYEEINHFNTFIDTIYFVLGLQGRKSVKILRLYDSKGSRKIATLPDKYKKIEDKYLNKDLILNDFICKYGDYTAVLNILLQNKSLLDYLVIVDCREYDDTVISGNYVIFNLCRRVSSIAKLGLSEINTITNDGTLLAWPVFNELQKFDGNNDDRFVFLSSRPVIQKIYESVKNFGGVV